MPEQENVQTATLEAKATLRYARISSRKVKIVADLIRGKKVDEALAIVKFTPKASSEILEKLLKSAIANAENNHGMNRGNLIVSEIYANQGPTLKRIRPTVRGSVMNPVDHPHGGGEGRAPVGHAGPLTPWGKPALGYKTRQKNKKSDKFIVKRRK